MRKAEFLVHFVKKEHLRAWREVNGYNRIAPEHEPLLKSGELGQNDIVRAENESQAAQIVEARFPGCVAIRDWTRKL